MTQRTELAQTILIPTRVESVQPNNDWTETWRLARIHGLGSNLTSFLFKLLHRLLPTQDRVQRLGVAVDGQPGLCQLCHLETEDALHALVHCPQSAVASLALLGHAQNVLPNLSPEAALRLDFGAKLEEEEELATVCLLATGWLYIWEARVDKMQVLRYKMRAELEAMIYILRKSRHSSAGERMLEMIDQVVV